MSLHEQNHFWEVAADTGGTFTDVVAFGPDGLRREAKVLSSGKIRMRCRGERERGSLLVEARDLPDGFLDGCPLGEGREVIAFGGGVLSYSGSGLEEIDYLEFDSGLSAPLLGAHLVTGTPLAKSLPPLRMRIATTRGTNALLEGKGVEVVLFTSEGFNDLLRIGNQTRPNLFARPIPPRRVLFSETASLPVRLDRNGDAIPISREEGDPSVSFAGNDLAEEGRVAVVSLCNGYINPEVEEEFAQKLRGSKWGKVITATSVRPLPGYLRRTETAVVEGYLSPILDSYLDAISHADGVTEVKVMTSAGGIVSRENFRAVDSLLSGPAGGVVGAVSAAKKVGEDSFLAFDMGGTSTDVSRFDGDLVYQSDLAVGDARVSSEALRIDTVAAGGGSICGFDGFGFTVGPESAGADPGPACYGKGGPLTITDVHLLLGRMDSKRFRFPLDIDASRGAFDLLLEKAGRPEAEANERREVLEGLLAIANEIMAGALRGISIAEGLDPADFALISFGGGGGLHACSLASMLGMKRIIQPGSAGILSAEGLSFARPEQMERRSILMPLDDFSGAASAIFAKLDEEGLSKLDPSKNSPLEWRREVFIRLLGQDAAMVCEWEEGVDLAEAFGQKFEEVFGFRQENISLEVESVRVRVRIRKDLPEVEEFPEGETVAPGEDGFLGGEELVSGNFGSGPCVISQRFGTLVVEKGWNFRVGGEGSILLESCGESDDSIARSEMAEVEHELFRNRFAAIVDSMGEVLRRTALSVNIRERLDFSCALLDGRGRLVVNAPHIPVHLGALGYCVRSVSEVLDWRPGDVAITNHPGFGGSHLPDVTVLAPVYSGASEPIAFLAVRAHHAEIGGIRPGSMPADAGSLGEEGVVVAPFHLLRRGEDHFERLRKVLKNDGENRGAGSRAPEINLADVSSQVAAIREGIHLLDELAERVGGEQMAFYMDRILQQSSDWIHRAIRAMPDSLARNRVEVELDGGEVIRVASRRLDDGRIEIDCSGTDSGTGSFQCPMGVSLSGILYVCRLIVDRDVPLNEGLLEAVEVKIPDGSLLAASFEGSDPFQMPPVVAGNVEVSQRLVEALIRLFGIEADSQGTMNNVIFGNETFSHYETLAGGSGASDRGPGASAVQVHMTNTAITDPEIIEHRFPVKVREFSIRRGSGGGGANVGGDGLIREYLFEEEVELSLLSQHRKEGPKGIHGGGSAMPGFQKLIHPDGRMEVLPFACTVRVAKGSCLRVETPGGGGYG